MINSDKMRAISGLGYMFSVVAKRAHQEPMMGAVDKQGVVTMQELLVSSLAQTDALTKLLIAKGLITEAEFME